MFKYLNEKCTDTDKVLHHEHGDSRGKDCKETENYTTAIVDATRERFLSCCEKITFPSPVDDIDGISHDASCVVIFPCANAAPSPEITPDNNQGPGCVLHGAGHSPTHPRT
jgi:hypothetical protein